PEIIGYQTSVVSARDELMVRPWLTVGRLTSTSCTVAVPTWNGGPGRTVVVGATVGATAVGGGGKLTIPAGWVGPGEV
ncbi:MAG TPA: hypothetical protein VMO88_04575, partial [Acidimicrobiales bacterium]|nr:hypothetical protein [Acidimicrobiales bacterium]